MSWEQWPQPSLSQERARRQEGQEEEAEQDGEGPGGGRVGTATLARRLHLEVKGG